MIDYRKEYRQQVEEITEDLKNLHADLGRRSIVEDLIELENRVRGLHVLNTIAFTDSIVRDIKEAYEDGDHA